LDINQVYGKLKSGKEGLTAEEAARRILIYGPNAIKSTQVTYFQIFLRQLKSPFVYLLFGASVISFILKEFVDSGMILGFILINTVLGFYQEYRSEQTIRLLKKYLVSKLKIIRDGVEIILDVTELVPGDLINFEPGDILPCDVRFIETQSMSIDESVLTGESLPVEKYSIVQEGLSDDIYKLRNIGFSGTTVIGGSGKGIVIATGEKMVYAKIADLAAKTSKSSSFESEIKRFSALTLKVVATTLIIVIAVSLAIKEKPSISELALFSVALAVSVIPEALPVVSTFSLSIGASKLTKKNVVVRRLSAVEDLGEIKVLCSDKTGTLTENKLTIDEIYSQKINKTLILAYLSSVVSKMSRNSGNIAFEHAIKEEIDRLRLNGELSLNRIIKSIPFDPVRKRMSSMVLNDKKYYIVSKGSFEQIKDICKIPEKDLNGFEKWLAEKGKEGRRVLAVCSKAVPSKNADISKSEKEMEFIGMISFIDPIKPSAHLAIAKAKELGVLVKILTGDTKEVAYDVAKKINLIETENEVITGEEFSKLNIDEKHKAVVDYQVFARVLPEQKYEIINLLKEKYFVGFLGEGINDAPALKASNVAIVVQGAADVAKESSDIVLLKKGLEVIMDGIEEGRKVFINTSKYITSTMTSNFGNFFAVAFVSLFIDFLPMLPLQLLLLNLLSDFPMIFVATDNVDPELLKYPMKYDLKSFLLISLLLGAISTAFDFIYFASFLPFGAKTLQTSWFIGSVLTEILFIYSIRSRRFLLKAKPASGLLILLSVIAIGFTFGIPYTNLGDKVFGFIKPDFVQVTRIVVIAGIYLILTEAAKLTFFKYSSSKVTS